MIQWQVDGAKTQKLGVQSQDPACIRPSDAIQTRQFTPMTLVKLNGRGVRAYMASGGAVYRRHPDWQSRTGRITGYSRDRSQAYVIWNGNRSSDRVSIDLIEPCSF